LSTLPSLQVSQECERFFPHTQNNSGNLAAIAAAVVAICLALAMIVGVLRSREDAPPEGYAPLV